LSLGQEKWLREQAVAATTIEIGHISIYYDYWKHGKRERYHKEVSMKGLAARFHQEMLAIHPRSGRATGYWPNRFLQKVRRIGGLAAAHDWLRPEKGLSPGLQRLAREGRTDLSMEALVIKEHWSRLFSDDELNEARRRLKATETVGRG
jgi:hypothetical protein